jgi:hypothetical protein
MSSQQNRDSKRFTPSRWLERLVPLILGLLLLALVLTVVFVTLSAIGVLPAGR